MVLAAEGLEGHKAKVPGVQEVVRASFIAKRCGVDDGCGDKDFLCAVSKSVNAEAN